MRRLVYLLPVALFLVVAGYFAWQLVRPNYDPRTLPSAMIDKPAPAFDLASLKGDGDFARDELKGQVVLVNFFASWCIPCRAEQPVLMQLARDAKATVYGISYKDKPEASRAFLAETGDPFARIAVDASGRTAIDFGLYGVPETYVVDRVGIIRFRQVGPLDPDTLAKQVLPLLAELAK
jgi:cytochrome c biogenesis protein CcmG, thiol:disulfide interchange protein DsbE